VERTKNLKEVVANTHFQNAAIKQICEPPILFVSRYKTSIQLRRSGRAMVQLRLRPLHAGSRSARVFLQPHENRLPANVRLFPLTAGFFAAFRGSQIIV
jgi:hypothetical protein